MVLRESVVTQYINRARHHLVASSTSANYADRWTCQHNSFCSQLLSSRLNIPDRNNSLLLLFDVTRVGSDRLCGLVVRVSGYRYRGPGFDSRGTTKKSSGSGTGSTQPCEYN
jgi:hypothetical protein